MVGFREQSRITLGKGEMSVKITELTVYSSQLMGVKHRL